MENTAYFRPTKAIVDLQAIRNNITGLRQHLAETTEIIAVVKANAYGHGDVEVSKAAIQAGASMLAVATPEEALHIRATISKIPIIILGAVPTDFLPFAAQQNITLTIFSRQWIKEAEKKFSSLVNQVKVHLKIDSGMGRIGVCDLQELHTLYTCVAESNLFELDGVFTHFATADEENSTYYEMQKDRFLQMVSSLPTKPRLVHAANTAASLVKVGVEFDAVRFGISMYGLSPSEYVNHHLPYTLQPALHLETTIVHVKKLRKGQHVGYGANYEVQQETEWIATLPIGYADGLLRGLEGQEVLVCGQRMPIIGRICMDQTMIRLPFELPVGEPVILIGNQSDEEILMEEWAEKLRTIVYEIACMISPRITRLYRG